MMSYGTKLSLLNSIITSLAMFAMCTIRIHQKILAQLDKTRRHCLWNKKTKVRDKCHSLAAWDMVCRPKKHGGLGVLNLKIQNDALLMKFFHKFYNRHNIPWVDLIWNTYYADTILHATDPCGSFWWKDVMQLSPIFRVVSSVWINYGSSVLFWKDSWHEEIISTYFPRAYSYTTDEDVTVRDFLSSSELHAIFHLHLSIQAHDEVKLMQDAVRDVAMSDQAHDEWTYVWVDSEFKASRYYAFYFRDMQAHEAFKWLWKSKGLLSIKVFGWLLLSDRLRGICLKGDTIMLEMTLTACFVEITTKERLNTCSFSAHSAKSVGPRLEYNGLTTTTACNRLLVQNRGGTDLYSWMSSWWQHGVYEKKETITTPEGSCQVYLPGNNVSRLTSPTWPIGFQRLWKLLSQP